MIAELRLYRLLFDRLVFGGTQFLDGQLFMHGGWSPDRFADELAISDTLSRWPIEVRMMGGSQEREILSWVAGRAGGMAHGFVFSVFESAKLRTAIAASLSKTPSEHLKSVSDVWEVMMKAGREVEHEQEVSDVIRRWNEWSRAKCIVKQEVDETWKSRSTSEAVGKLQRLASGCAGSEMNGTAARRCIEQMASQLEQCEIWRNVRRSDIDRTYQLASSQYMMPVDRYRVNCAKKIVYDGSDADRAMQHGCSFGRAGIQAGMLEGQMRASEEAIRAIEGDGAREVVVCPQFMEFLGRASAAEFNEIVRESNDARSELLVQLEMGKPPSAGQYWRVLEAAVKRAAKKEFLEPPQGVRIILNVLVGCAEAVAKGWIDRLIGVHVDGCDPGKALEEPKTGVFSRVAERIRCELSEFIVVITTGRGIAADCVEWYNGSVEAGATPEWPLRK